MRSDAQVIAAACHDPQAFVEVFERYYDRIYRYCARRVGPDEGQDLASETFVVALRSIRRYDPRYISAAPWLFGIATKLVARHRRQEARTLRHAGVQPVEDHADAVVDRVVATSQNAAIALALAALKPRDRDAILLLALGELSYDDIALALGIPLGTVRSRIHRARTQLRRHLDLPGEPS